MTSQQEPSAQLPEEGRRPADSRQNNEKVPLLGAKPGFKSRDRSVCSGAGTLACVALVIVVATVIYGIHELTKIFKSPTKGPNLLADYQTRHFLTPAAPSQPPPARPDEQAERRLSVWPRRPVGSAIQHGPLDTPADTKLPLEPPAELRSGTLAARIHHKNHAPSWHTLGDANGLSLGAASKPLFSLLPSKHHGPKLTSKECTAGASEQDEHRLRLRLSCPFNIEANFEIRVPVNDATGYLRFSVELWSKSGSWPKGLSTLRLLDASIPASTHVLLTGPQSEPGLPTVLGGKLFVGGEHPMAFTGVFGSSEEPSSPSSTASGVFIDIRHLQDLSQPTSAKPWRFGAVLGIVPEVSQARRAFVNYLHNERPGRRTPMVHYNSWFDFSGWQDEGFFHERADRGDIMNETSCIERVNEFGQHLVKDHDVKLDSFLIDDGWDNTETLWDFDKKRFPRGFTRVAETARTYGSGVGVWLSPWGGYGASKKNRVREGKARGLETRIDPWGEEAFDLGGPKYKAWFMKTVMRMRRDEGVNLFKFDGVSRAPREMEAMLGMLADVREVGVANRAQNQDEDKVWISLTTGTWPSPFFLFWSDNIWRGDGDVGPYPGQEPVDGLSQRQKWIRWRAQKVQEHVVKQSTFFPLSQLMIHGVVLAGHGEALYAGLGQANDVEFAQEVWSFLGLGLQLQELYISPKRMTQSTWALLAEGLAWARKNAQVLLDTHWAFGDVSRHQVFCTASWDPREKRGFVLLQNPLGATQDSRPFSLAKVLELPHSQANALLEVSLVKAVAGQEEPGVKTSAASLTACKPTEGQTACRIQANTATGISLKHTEVVMLEVHLAA